MKRHVPPSRVRYEQANRVVSTRLPSDSYEELEAAAEDRSMSIAAFVREAVIEGIDAGAEVAELEEDLEEARGESAELSRQVAAATDESARDKQTTALLTQGIRDLQAEVTKRTRAIQDSEGQNALLRRHLATQTTRAEAAQSELADIAGPDDRFLKCPSCRSPWHKHVRKDAEDSWRCVRYIRIVR